MKRTEVGRVMKNLDKSILNSRIENGKCHECSSSIASLYSVFRLVFGFGCCLLSGSRLVLERGAQITDNQVILQVYLERKQGAAEPSTAASEQLQRRLDSRSRMLKGNDITPLNSEVSYLYLGEHITERSIPTAALKAALAEAFDGALPARDHMRLREKNGIKVTKVMREASPSWLPQWGPQWWLWLQVFVDSLSLEENAKREKGKTAGCQGNSCSRNQRT